MTTQIDSLIAGIDYDPAVCDNCGRDEHTPAELATCIASAIGPDQRQLEDDLDAAERRANGPGASGVLYTNYFTQLDRDI